MIDRKALLSRRSVVAGLAALGIPTLSGCTGRQSELSLAPAVPNGSGLNAVIDMSHFSVVSDFTAIRNRSNILAIIHKASEGGDWIDPLYRTR